jgi:hypothetical protein
MSDRAIILGCTLLAVITLLPVAAFVVMYARYRWRIRGGSRAKYLAPDIGSMQLTRSRAHHRAEALREFYRHRGMHSAPYNAVRRNILEPAANEAERRPARFRP